MPNSLSKDQIGSLIQMANNGNLVGVYQYLQQNGYQYAGLALGVVTGSTVSGAAALGFLNTSAQINGVNLTSTQLTQIKTELTKDYLNLLLNQAVNNGGTTNTDITWQDAWAIHNQTFYNNGLPNDVWTLNTPFSVLDPATSQQLWNDLLKDQNGSFISTTGSILELGKDMETAYFNATNPSVKAQIGNWFSKITTDNVIEGEAGMFFNSVKGFLLNSTDGVQNYTNQDAQSIAQQAYPTLQLAGDDPDATAEALAQAQKQQNLRYEITKYFGAMPGPLQILDNGTTLTIANSNMQVSITGGQTVVSVKDASGNINAAEYNQSGVLVDSMHIGSNGAPTDNTVYDASGRETEYATFGTNGLKTQDIFYDPTTGHATERDDYNADGSAVANLFHADGSQDQIYYNAAGHQTEQASFGTNGKITQDILYDATTGHETQERDWSADGSSVAHLYNSNGTQNAIAYDASGRETEYATFGTNGKITQDTFYDIATGRATERDDYNADGSAVANLFHADGSQDQIYYNAAGHQTEQASFGTNGKITRDIVYDAATGHETQESDWNADGSWTTHLLNANGSENAIAYDAYGRETEYATFGTNGKITQDTFYDVATGRATERDDYNADGSAVANLFHADGSQDQIYYNAAGHQTEQASFGTNGKITQDILYDATTGRETQERDWSADGSSVAHLYNSNGTQNAIAYDAAGRETEYATFGTNGKITQDTFYDATTGRATERDDYNADGSGIAHIFNADGTQNSAIFDPSGHVSEYATFAANGALTSDAFFDKNGRETELIEFSGNQQIVHLLNADNSQTAIVYNGNGQEVEYASFNTSGQKTDDWFWDGPSGRLIEYDQYGSNGSMTAHQFNANGTQDAIIFNGNGQEMEYDSYDTNGNLTGFTQFTYGVGGGYNAVAYGPTGYETGWADYGSNNMLVSSGGNQYNFTLDDSYDSGSDDYDFGWFDDTSYSNEYGFYI
ncbi:hypothetical protein B0G69_5028 [Paraburkholderia sp. RAU2J]|uniref:hypothetical protein n=1 Tax=Paraburkholderia sp. RAU2J TaxID=1938810 RepID=UPI000F1D94DE|nr:hypothetical protein [Paraburkholderia sp. RAU2J]RKT21632.1 hypothetical protein B0G69_5028 [Paraburkholderia sp. RAU2J]